MEEISSDRSTQRNKNQFFLPTLPTLLARNRRKIDEIYPPHLLAQKLNNRASFLITIKKYDEAMVLLSKALRMADRSIPLSSSSSTRKSSRRCCKFCSLDACLGRRHDSFSCTIIGEEDEEDNYCRKIDQNRNENCPDETECDHDDNTGVSRSQAQHKNLPNSDDIELQHGGFVHRQPLFVHKHCIERGHYMGKLLNVIVLYNLALANHLHAISMDTNASSSSPDDDPDSQIEGLEKALDLYQLAYEFHVQCVRQLTGQSSAAIECFGSLRFIMIISNNLGEIHRVAGSPAKHKLCLQHLLKGIMFSVDRNLDVFDSREMDGFYLNVTPLLLVDVCAATA